MLKFFRQIRQQLLKDNQMKKYSLYAIGEIVLVVLGILIALQINNWNTKRIERGQEKQILKQLQNEYLDNKKQLENKIAIRNFMNTSANKLIGYYEKGIENLNQDSLDKHLAITFIRPTLNPALGVTNELINSGKLYLLENEELRTLISNWPGKYFSELQEEENLVVKMVDDYYPFVLKKYQLRRAWNTIFNSSMSKYTVLDEINIERVSFINSRVKEDASALFADDDFADHLATLIIYVVSANASSNAVMKKIDQILTIIQQELNQ